MKGSLFITCFNDTLFPETGRAVVYLLERLGYTNFFLLSGENGGKKCYDPESMSVLLSSPFPSLESMLPFLTRTVLPQSSSVQ